MKRFFAALLAMAGIQAYAGERVIEQDVVVAAPLQAVWQAWTTKAGLESFFAPEAHIAPVPDGQLDLFFNPYGTPGTKGADGMRVLAVQDQRLLSFSWNAPPHLPDARKQRTVVILRFTRVSDSSTRVALTQTGWGDGGQWDDAYAYFSKAWPTVFGNLQKRFVNGPIDWTAHLAAMKKHTDDAMRTAK
ncbi:MAG TPA: SRPBCC domain-containing protein [Burkholderiaceae bacterium]